jgi:CrcB protein
MSAPYRRVIVPIRSTTVDSPERDMGLDDQLAESIDPEIEEASSGVTLRPRLSHAAAVFVGGFLGTFGRYAFIKQFPVAPDSFPWTIVMINVSGSLLLGVVAGGLVSARRRPGLRLFLGAGVLGGWTTYSAIIAGVLTEVHAKAPVVAGLNLLVSLTLPTAAAMVGLLLGSRLSKSTEARS